MQTKTIYLIRHAQPHYPGGARMCLGQSCDLPLSEYGHAQAQMLRRFFADKRLDAVYSSPLLRARQTAEVIADTPLVIMDNHIELDGGEWDGMPFSLLHEKYPQYFVPGARLTCPPGGESDEDGILRARTALEIIAARTQRCAAAVAHGALNRLILCAVSGRPFSQKKQFGQEHGCVNILTCTGSVWRAEAINIKAEDL